MILKFKFKSMWWGRAGMRGPNLFIKNPSTGLYANHGIGPLKNEKAGSSIDELGLNELIRRKHVEILAEYNEDEIKEGLCDEDTSEVPSPKF